MGFVTKSIEDRVAVLTINKPPANALSSALIQEISSIFNELEHDENVRAIVLKGDGRFFSAGADIKEFTTINTADDFAKLAENGQEIFEKIEKFNKPVIASIHGAALGGGLELAMACHIRYVADNAKLGLPELQLGLVPGFAGSQRLPRYVGMAKAAEMLFTSEPISGKEAVQWGLANAAFPEEELHEASIKLAKKIAAKSPLALSKAIELLNYSKHENYYAGVKKEADSFGDIFVSADAKEGISAFIEKRQPQFTGK
ncbi:enoyl-CoA hydratase [Bacillus sp. AGMB 02131]|uniref:Enoyl-CoA hydratase n=1 Tax=Peribacillus faecalis TaxID=2772559 RepID=A0A927CVP3_9BACI|nr:enoyl-CoA hydratase [Peribacillus faecalis]MBD3108376.1 enoyl-CoA hydratase [Peribacillus faecalis]